ncbi:hypothetical protein MNQ98_01970 [Paenibacillus sp. N3/727]|uniref:hypothetical protein n=1 Tax=Paenibacillus sp. N3/727 TaxID=2925845 RepID=UPI001F539489|nr:hypothetical protein [Paenibacillus sp. N3/727]UNK18839.1 hypothetical protein MNQ98_01970 [Paenibacillus sp. N3/727]
MSTLLYRSLVLMFILSLFPTPFAHHFAAAKKLSETAITISIRSTPTAALESKIKLNTAQIKQLMKNVKEEEGTAPTSLTDVYVTIEHNDQSEHYRLDFANHLWNVSEKKCLILSDSAIAQMKKYVEALRKKHYGRIVPWKDIKTMLPRKSMFAVTDLETGLTFRVQRRAGSDHADVQPLTTADTKIMKQIYNNQWSWNRKAIIVQKGNEKLAASMNGMPHGGDGIPENGFKGHFCIHFLGSSTHRSVHTDLLHQLMVHKAAGEQKRYISTASPYMLAHIFIESINQQDTELLRQVSEGLPSQTFESIIHEMDNINAARIQKKYDHETKDADNNLLQEITLPVALQYKGKRTKNVTYRFVFARESLQSPWLVRDFSQ